MAAVVSMELYRAVSPQARIAELREKLASTQRTLTEHDGAFEEAWPLIKQMLRLALTRVFAVLPASIIASLPLLTLVLWLDCSYARTFPPRGQAVTVIAPGEYLGEWIEDDDKPRVAVVDPAGIRVTETKLEAPIPVLHKQRWWNVLFGNPAGYLAEDAPVDHVEIALPRREVHSLGPDWFRRWEIVFFPGLVVMAVALKYIRRIQ